MNRFQRAEIISEKKKNTNLANVWFPLSQLNVDIIQAGGF